MLHFALRYCVLDGINNRSRKRAPPRRNGHPCFGIGEKTGPGFDILSNRSTLGLCELSESGDPQTDLRCAILEVTRTTEFPITDPGHFDNGVTRLPFFTVDATFTVLDIARP